MTARALVAAIVLAVLPGLACAVSASTSSSTGQPSSGAGHGSTGKPALQAGDSGAPASSGGQANEGGTQVPATGPASGVGAPACVPALNDLYTSLFSGRVLMRLPKGVELVEQNGFYATMAASQQSTSCGAPIKYMAVGFFQQPAVDLMKVRDQLLELRGISAATVTWSEEGTRGRNYTGAYAAAQDPKTSAPPSRGWLVLREAANDKYAYFAVLETDENSWAGLSALFQEAGRHLLVKPRALQAPEVIAPKPEEPQPPKKPKAKASSKAAGGAATGK